MKNKISISLILSIILIGCSNLSKTNIVNTQIACNELEDHVVFTNTANIWVGSWNSVLNEIFTEEQLAQHSPEYKFKRSFDPLKVLGYINKCVDCEDVRIYFVDLHNLSNKLWIVNDLLMVNVQNCEDKIGDSLLVADSFETYEITLEQAREAVSLKLQNDTGALSNPFIKNIYAYTFDKRTIQKFAEEAVSLQEKMDFVFAIHDASPSESITPYIMNTKGLLAVDLLLKNQSQGETKFSDFARPCPELCGYESPLYYLNN